MQGAAESHGAGSKPYPCPFLHTSSLSLHICKVGAINISPQNIHEMIHGESFGRSQVHRQCSIDVSYYVNTNYAPGLILSSVAGLISEINKKPCLPET